jgi:hypothetical protein
LSEPHGYLADCLSRIRPEDCPDDEMRLKASEAAADYINANLAEFRRPGMAVATASAGIKFRNKWYSEHGGSIHQN